MSDLTSPTAAAAVGDYILRVDAVESTTGLSRNTIWQRVREHKFPPSVELGGGRVGWRASAIRKWIDDLPNTDECARAAKFSGKHYTRGRKRGGASK